MTRKAVMTRTLKQRRFHNSPRRQRGVVLILSLMLLLATTIIGFSVMETSNLEAKMAAAKQGKETSFQAAESIIEIGLDDQPYIASARQADLAGSAWPTDSHSFTYDSGLSGGSEMEYRTSSIAYGEDWARGLKNEHFQMRATVTRAGSPFDSEHVQGFKVKSPTL